MSLRFGFWCYVLKCAKFRVFLFAGKKNDFFDIERTLWDLIIDPPKVPLSSTSTNIIIDCRVYLGWI